MRDITLEDTFFKGFSTRAFATGIPTTLAGTPVVSAYENADLTQITAGITLGVDHDSVTGFHMLTVVATAANGYENGKDYTFVITTGTVGGVSVVGEIVGEFSIGRSAAAVDLANATDGLSALKAILDTSGVKLGDVAHGGTAALLTLERLIIASTTATEPAMKLTGNTSGAGLECNGGTTGAGLKTLGGGTSGVGIQAEAQASTSAGLNVVSSDGTALLCTGGGAGEGLGLIAGATGHGIHSRGGVTSGRGIFAEGRAGNDAGLFCEGAGSGAGIHAIGDASTGTGPGILASGGATSGVGINAVAVGNASGLKCDGGGTEDGIEAIGGATGNGIVGKGGVTSGHGMVVQSVTTGNGLQVTAAGTNQDGAIYSATGSGADISADIVGDITGNLSGSVGSVVGHTAQTGDNFARLGAPAGASVSADIAALNDPTSAAIAGAVWDEVLTGATHNVINSSGRRLRQLQEAGSYAGAVWVDTVNGTAGTTNFENGTDTNPVDSIADADTLATSLGLSRFNIAPGSTITFVATQANQSFVGTDSWTLALGGQSIDGSTFVGARVSGIANNTTGTQYFIRCDMGACTLPGDTHVLESGIAGTQTAGEAGDYFYDRCHSAIAGTGTTMFDFGAGLNASNLSFRHFSGGLEIQNMGAGTGSYNMSLEGWGQFLINANCSATSTVAIRGHFTVTDNAGGAVTLSDDARIDVAQINAECDTAISDAGLATAIENADALLKRDMSAVTGEAARSPLNALRLLRNKVSESGGTLTVTEEDDSTTAWTAAVTTNAAADPIVTIDPA